MFRAYLIAAITALAGFGYAQYQGWSLLDESEHLKGGPQQTQRHK